MPLYIDVIVSSGIDRGFDIALHYKRRRLGRARTLSMPSDCHRGHRQRREMSAAA